MDETILTKSQLKTTADYKAAFVRLMEQVTEVEERMQSDRVIIERLKTETQILKAESDLIKARTQQRLDSLMGAG
jgi:hypothetical protein